MTYRWTPEGPVFEFPTPYGTENKLLGVRGYVLIACAIALTLVVLLVDSGQADRPAFSLDKLPEKASVVPHLAAAAWLALLGLLDLLRAKRQRVLQLLPGQPASLMFEVSREGSGASGGASKLLDMLEGKPVAAAPTLGAYAVWLDRLLAGAGAAPSTLQAYLSQRLSNLLVWSGLLLILALEWLLLPHPAAAPLVALLLGTLAAALGARQALMPEQPGWAPWPLAALLLAALLLSAGAGGFAQRVPGVGHLGNLGLAPGLALLLIGALLLEAIGILAARAQWLGTGSSRAALSEAGLGADVVVDADALLRELDLELHRRWTEGVPNRRYARQGGATADAQGDFALRLLEESQPVVAPPARGRAPTAAAAAPSPARLLALGVVGLSFSAAGGLLWIVLAYAHMGHASASWMAGATGLSCLLLGGYALRLAHLLWSRVEVQSTITWLDFSGRVAAGEAVAPGQRAPMRVIDMSLSARAALARSVFYAAAPYGMGSRVLLDTQAHAAEAGAWTAFLQAFAGQPVVPAPARPAAPVPPDRGRELRRPEPEPPVPPARQRRFCSACGTPVLQGARFCQHCGNDLGSP